MRKNDFVMRIASMIIGCVLLAACTSNDDVPTGFDQRMTDYTRDLWQTDI